MATQSYNTPLLPAVSYPTTIVERGPFVYQDGVVLCAFVAHGIIISIGSITTIFLGIKHVRLNNVNCCLITAL